MTAIGPALSKLSIQPVGTAKSPTSGDELRVQLCTVLDMAYKSYGNSDTILAVHRVFFYVRDVPNGLHRVMGEVRT